MRVKSLKVTLAAIIAAAYAILVIALPFVSFLAYQVRIADCLIPLSMILGYPAIIGITMGCFIANYFAPWPNPSLIMIDMIGGSLANFIAGCISYYVYKKIKNKVNSIIALQIGCIIESLVITFIVGTYLKYLLETVNISLPIYVCWIGVLVGSLIAINILGYTISLTLRKVLPRSVLENR